MAIGTIPPWISVSPSDFLQATQSGASTGLQVAQLRQQAGLAAAARAQAAQQAAAARAQAAAESAAARDDAMARAEQALAFQRWEREQLGQAAAAKLAQDAAQAQALLGLRAEEAEARRARERGQLELGRERLGAQKEHWRAMEQNQADRIKQQLNLPSKTKINVVGRNIVAVDPDTEEVRVLYTSPPTPQWASQVRVYGLPVNPSVPKSGMASGSLSHPYIQSLMGTNAPAPPSIKVLSLERDNPEGE